MDWFGLIWLALNIISRAGGGGSSSSRSSSGGGGSSSSRSSSGGYSDSGGSGWTGFVNFIVAAVAASVAFVAMIALFAFQGWFLRKLAKITSKLTARIVSIFLSVAFMMIGVLIVSGDVLPFKVSIAGNDISLFLFAPVFMSGLFLFLSSLSRDFLVDPINKIVRRSREVSLKQSAAKDNVWNKTKIIKRAKRVFHQYQNDWMNKNLESIKTYTTSRYFSHASLMLKAIQQMGRHSDLSNIKIHSAVVTDFHDHKDDGKDRVTVMFRAQMYALFIETDSGNVLQEDDSKFIEWWNFVRQGGEWMLDGIDQATEDQSQLLIDLKNFAQANNMHFSPDWGHQLIPTHGQLFKNGFAGTDINNHVIGRWGDLIVQLYTYSPNINQTAPTYYVIGQINLPKSYGGIMVLRRGHGLFNRLHIPQGYAKYELEWGDFNKRYDVLATDMDKVTSFELLNPAFMAWLYDCNLKVNIEVADNVVYLYAKVKVGENRYSDMLEILSKSHAELKM